MSAKWTRVEPGFYTCDFSEGCMWRALLTRICGGSWFVQIVDKADPGYIHPSGQCHAHTLKEAKDWAYRFIFGGLQK
jgi:hypothetical protein